MVVAVDDEAPVSLIRPFNESAGKKFLMDKGIPAAQADLLDLLGISGAGNLIGTIKFARYYELDENDVVMTVLTDLMEMYVSCLKELTKDRGVFHRKRRGSGFRKVFTRAFHRPYGRADVQWPQKDSSS